MVYYDRHKLDFIQNLKVPCAIFIATDDCLTSGIREVNSYNIDKILKITNSLREVGMEAVPCFCEEAADPSKIVVTAGGIQTPVLDPKKAKEVTEQIYATLMENPIKEKRNPICPLYTALPVEISQMADISLTSKPYMAGTFIDADMSNPLSTKIREKYGFGLEEELYREVVDSPKLIPVDDLYQKNEKTLTCLYRGGTIGDMPYISLAARESKNLAYSTPDIKTALIYSGCYKDSYGSNIKIPTERGDSIHFGFVYEFDAGEQCSLYKDWSIEQGGSPAIKKKTSEVSRKDWEGQSFEQPVFPSKNKVKNIYMHVRKDGEDYLYPINQKDERFNALLTLYRPTDTSKRGYMIDRRKNILKDKKVYHSFKAKTLGIFTKKLKPYEFNLSKEDLMKLANMTIEEKIAQQKENKTSRDSSTRLRQLRGIKKDLTHSKAPKVAPIYIAKKVKECRY